MKEKTESRAYVPGIILGIVGIVFSVLFPAVTYSCSVPGLVLSVKRRNTGRRTVGAFVLNVVALAAALANSVTAVCITARGFFKKRTGEC